MPFCKIKVDYGNAEGWKIGQVVDITNPWLLIKEGKVVLVDGNGTEIAPPSETRSCPICLVFKTSEPYDLAEHIIEAHPKIEPIASGVVEAPKIETVEKPQTIAETPFAKEEVVIGGPKAFKDMTPEEKKDWRVENLRKAREVAKAKKEAELTVEALKKVVAKNG